MEEELPAWQKRSISVVGPRGVLAGLDEIPTICRVKIFEHGGDGYSMSPGSAVIMVWGSDDEECFDIERKLNELGYNVVIIRHEARSIDRLHRSIMYWKMSFIWALQKAFSS